MSNVQKVLFCCGSRPELIKICPLYHKLKTIPTITPLLCNTGQHKDLLDPHFTSLNIEPDYCLNVMRKGQSLDQLMALLFEQLPDLFDQASPHMVIIQGDTATALASAIIAHKKNIPLVHIEAGLRTYDISSPFPEEIYRQNITKLAKWHFCPTEKSRQNLLRENIPAENIFMTGNTSVDMVIKMAQKLKEYPHPLSEQKNRPYFLITLHRRESQGAPLQEIIHSLIEFSKSKAEFDFIIPLHPNPATSDMIRHLCSDQKNIKLISPLPYPDFVQLMAKSYAIITDSGGIQEEAPSLNIPVIVVRNNTERYEGVENGCLRLAGTEKKTILYELNLLFMTKIIIKECNRHAIHSGTVSQQTG
ncbi:MAG: UDP-N-acetylglucosamine 2-epimerase (non-hydrolyzing) [Emcibacter sp.]|nr:UDP-N-acetylglucosamine 2-epimerase (non-hydrolyzing) [Emcibacter sp.]